MYIVPVNRPTAHLARMFDRLLDAGALEGAPAAHSPSLDVAESEGGYAVSIDLPGVAKDDVKITIDGRRIDVSAQAQREQSHSDGAEAPRLIHRERSSRSFARSFTLPQEVDQDASQAKLDNGVLRLNLAKKRTAANKHLTVN